MVKQNPCIKQGLCYNKLYFKKGAKMKKYSKLKRNEPDYLLSFFFGGVAFLLVVGVFTLALHGVI
jgi:hypothetical protein